MKLLAIMFWQARVWYLEGALGRVKRQAPTHAEVNLTDWELQQSRAALARCHRRIEMDRPINPDRIVSVGIGAALGFGISMLLIEWVAR